MLIVTTLVHLQMLISLFTGHDGISSNLNRHKERVLNAVMNF
jgi:hypothetical protein